MNRRGFLGRFLGAVAGAALLPKLDFQPDKNPVEIHWLTPMDSPLEDICSTKSVTVSLEELQAYLGAPRSGVQARPQGRGVRLREGRRWPRKGNASETSGAHPRP